MQGIRNRAGGITLGSAIRDLIVNLLPIKRLPKAWIQRLYGRDVSFIFLTHPRNTQDIYKTFPLLRRLRTIFPEKMIFHILSFCPCFVAARVATNRGLSGFFVSTSLFPESLFNNRDRTLRNASRILNFISKITTGPVYVGLAAWWPIVTNAGAAFQRFNRENDRIIITNGHTCTLASIFLSVEKIALISNVPVGSLEILIIGAGKMGGAVAAALNSRVYKIGLVDQNERRLCSLAEELRNGKKGSEIEQFVVNSGTFSDIVLPALTKYHIAVCTTSNIGYVIEDASKLTNCVILDDARPEAFPRIVSVARNAVVLEGGLMKIDGVQVDSDFGFGTDRNVFGCLAEALLLSIDQAKTLLPTVGDIGMDNFKQFLSVCEENGIVQGDFVSGHVHVEDAVIKSVMHAKMAIMATSKE
ncbi:MAG: hypothetical protein A3G87_01345 [Omnitrophica bacterium RIFCSPLOWO2_12_FULL_50_11]|nr:MAG: hypothetical protein A3G87_01345 [Omnitrophica bacterium RIFCSPLOWO2_12_FULL_50_11]